MSWHTGSLITVREQFVLAALTQQGSFAQLCQRFHIARVTGYKWCRRFRREGRSGLGDRSRRPRRVPRQLPGRWPQAVRRLRQRHPTWGPRKLRARLRHLHPRIRLPAPRTLARWLQRLGLVKIRRRHQRHGPQSPKPRRTIARRTNQVWTVDFKGWFRTRDGTRVEPLTVRDLKSRFLLAVALLPNQDEGHARRAFTKIFRRAGLPQAIQVDNGPPFGGVGPLGLSRLSVWWRRLGIKVEFGRPAHPEDNAGHEQMHAVYQNEVATHPSADRRAQQSRSDRWRSEYNTIRPHEALQGRTPAQLYRPSARPWPQKLPDWFYPKTWTQRRVSPDGRLFWQGRQRFMGRAFGREIIALRPLQTGVWEVFLGRDLLGTLHQRDRSRSLRPARYIHKL